MRYNNLNLNINKDLQKDKQQLIIRKTIDQLYFLYLSTCTMEHPSKIECLSR